MGAAILLRSGEFNSLKPSAVLFGEAQSRVVVSLRTERQLKTLEKLALEHQIKAQWIGSVGGDTLRIAIDGKVLINEPIETLKRVHSNSIRTIMSPAQVND